MRSQNRSGSIEALKRSLGRLMATRLLLAVLAFGLALVVIGVGRPDADDAERGLYVTLAAAFCATAVYAALLRRVQRPRRFAVLQLATDLAIVTALVAFSGAGDSIFSFLYLPIVVYGAVLFGRAGAYGSAAVASASYGAVLAVGTGLSGSLARELAPEMSFALWGAHTGALVLVALLSSTLARELRVAGERLDENTRDLDALRSLHERTVACLTSGLLTTDGSGRISSFNPEAERITGLRAADAIGRNLDDVLPGAAALAPRSVAQPGRVRARLAVPGAEGASRHLGIASSVLRSAEGGPAGSVVIFQDVTDVVRMEAELRRTARLAGIGQLAADIAHEIRNPLAAISGSVEMLAGGLQIEPADVERGRLMGIVLREIDRLNQLITDFLGYARPSIPEPVSVDVGAVAREVAEVFEGARPPGVALEIEAPPGQLALADAKQLRQVLWNLIRNAAEALGASGRIRVEIAAATAQEGTSDDRNADGEGPASVEICVQDDGPGIPPEVLERIFDPFFTTKAGGTGLGLATVHRIVEAHGGHLGVETAVGSGTCFRVRLPAAPPPGGAG